MTPRELLLIPMGENDSGASTVGGYLQKLLYKVWEEGEGFNGKRPFGNSGWDSDLQKPIIAAGISTGTLDSDGYVEEVGDADSFVSEAIGALFSEDVATDEANRIAAVVLRREADRLDPDRADDDGDDE